MTPPTRVLLVEDDETLLGAYRVVLEAGGFAVAGAATAGEALERLRSDGAEIVVADLGLPDLSGPGLVERLRGAAPGARLVVLTGASGEGLRRRCAEAGADDFLEKPVSGADLEAELTG